MDYSDLEQQAASFAARQHRGQYRKYGPGRPTPPYISHPAAVADIVRSVSHTDEMLAAAWLHDVVEDCGVPIGCIDQRFGARVGYLVAALTDVAKTEDGNRAVRVAMNREHSATGDAQSQTIKLADMIHNTYRINVVAPEFAPVYLAEKERLVAALTLADPDLMLFQRSMVGGDQDDFKYEHACAHTLYLALR